jgi:hypothetical protein
VLFSIPHTFVEDLKQIQVTSHFDLLFALKIHKHDYFHNLLQAMRNALNPTIESPGKNDARSEHRDMEQDNQSKNSVEDIYSSYS